MLPLEVGNHKYYSSAATNTQIAAPQPPRLLDQVAQTARQRGASEPTTAQLVDWVRAYVLFHNKRHPSEPNLAAVTRFLEHVVRTEKQPLPALESARSALELLYSTVLGIDLGELPRPRPPRLLDQMSQVLRVRHYSPRTEACYLHWVRQFILFHGKHHPRDLAAAEVVRVVRARYDAAGTSDDNRRHWANADGLSANQANSAEVRRVLRNRARYETANNSYAKGIVLTLANDVVGTGPRLQFLTEDSEANTRIEREFTAWAKAVGLPEKLRTLRMARATDGEAFAVLTSNPRLATPVQLDLRLIEADRVCTPDLNTVVSNAVDGILFDAAGNPVEYHVLKQHPGDTMGRYVLEFDRVPAQSMLHWFRCDRPGQARGVPDILPALPLFAQLRRFTLAVIAAAETAADFAGILYTDAPASGEADAAEPFEPIELEKRALVTMPGGWKMSQLQAEQPSTGYAEFKHEILNEIARCLNMPFKVGASETHLSATSTSSPPVFPRRRFPGSGSSPLGRDIAMQSANNADNSATDGICNGHAPHRSPKPDTGIAAMNTTEPEPTDAGLPDDVAEAWATVLIDIHERLEAEQAQPEPNDEATSPSRPVARVAAEHDAPGGDPTSPTDAEDRPCTA